jgi:hypothetical protein
VSFLDSLNSRGLFRNFRDISVSQDNASQYSGDRQFHGPEEEDDDDEDDEDEAPCFRLYLPLKRSTIDFVW